MGKAPAGEEIPSLRNLRQLHGFDGPDQVVKMAEIGLGIAGIAVSRSVHDVIGLAVLLCGIGTG